MAVKTLKLANLTNLQRFKSEILLQQQLKHENIVGFIGCIWDRSLVALVLEMVSNGDVCTALKNPSLTMTWEDPKLRIAIQTAHGMEYLHTVQYFNEEKQAMVNCIIHRDLKPSNMLLTPTFLLKLTDFGESRAKDIDHTMTVVGTPLYVAPEVVNGERYDEKVRDDI